MKTILKMMQSSTVFVHILAAKAFLYRWPTHCHCTSEQIGPLPQLRDQRRNQWQGADAVAAAAAAAADDDDDETCL